MIVIGEREFMTAVEQLIEAVKNTAMDGRLKTKYQIKLDPFTFGACIARIIGEMQGEPPVYILKAGKTLDDLNFVFHSTELLKCRG